MLATAEPALLAKCSIKPQLRVHTAANKSVQAALLLGKPVWLGVSLKDRQMRVHPVLHENLPCRMLHSIHALRQVRVRCVTLCMADAYAEPGARSICLFSGVIPSCTALQPGKTCLQLYTPKLGHIPDQDSYQCHDFVEKCFSNTACAEQVPGDSSPTSATVCSTTESLCHDEVQILTCLRSSSGVGLRTLYLPGLQGLKEELRMMDWLMERLMPELKQHLDASALYCILQCMLLSPLAASYLASC